MSLSPAQILNNRYQIIELLGQGGFGAVYLALDMNLDKSCAVKENLITTEESQRQFKREALILSDLSHPNLPHVIDHFIITGQGQYLVMDFVKGEDLEEMLKRIGGPLSEKSVLEWTDQIFDAIRYLHSHVPPIIHRDIKPANIKITPEGTAKLVDFGIAKIYDVRLTTTAGARAVTSGYSPPEQYGEGKTDEKSDIYALGATLYTSLTGKIPPPSIDIVSGNAVLPEARNVNPRLSLGVSKAIARAMQPNRSHRFDNISEFHSALRQGSPPPLTTAQVVTPRKRSAIQYKKTEVIPVPKKNFNKPYLVIGGLFLTICLILCLIGSGVYANYYLKNQSATRTEIAKGERSITTSAQFTIASHTFTETPAPSITNNRTQYTLTPLVISQTPTHTPTETKTTTPTPTSPYEHLPTVIPIINNPAWTGGRTNIVPENHMGQTFIPYGSVILKIGVDITTAVRGRGGDTLTMNLLSKDRQLLASGSKFISEGYDGWVDFEIDHGGVVVNSSDLLIIELNDSGKIVFHWKYGQDDYPDGSAILLNKIDPEYDFFFRINY